MQSNLTLLCICCLLSMHGVHAAAPTHALRLDKLKSYYQDNRQQRLLLSLVEVLYHRHDNALTLHDSGTDQYTRRYVPLLESKHRIAKPLLFYIDDAALIASSLSFGKSASAIILSRGALEGKSTQDIDGIIQHELSHIIHGHTLKRALLNMIGGSIVGGLAVATLIAYRQKGHHTLTGIYGLSNILSLIIFAAVRRQQAALHEHETSKQDSVLFSH